MNDVNLHADSLEEHILTDKSRVELDAWLEVVGDLLNDDKIEDVKAALIKEMRKEFRSQLQGIKSAIRWNARDASEAFRDFCTDTIDCILADQDWDALATKILVKSHESAQADDDTQERIAF